MVKDYEISLYAGEDTFMRYYIDNQDDYLDFEVIFEEGKFNGVIVAYKHPLTEDSMECEEVLLNENDAMYKALKDRAIMDYNS